MDKMMGDQVVQVVDKMQDKVVLVAEQVLADKDLQVLLR